MKQMGDQSIMVLKKVNSLLINNEFEKALILLENSLLTEEVRNECFGNYYYYKCDYEKAIEYYRRVLSFNPEYRLSRYQCLSGVGHEQLNEYEKAFRNYQEAIDIDPNFVDPYVELGALLTKVEAYDGAATCFRDAIRITPDDLTLYFNLKSILEIKATGTPEDRKELAEIKIKIVDLESKGVKLPQKRQWQRYLAIV